MSEWVESPLAELANIVSGGTPSRDVPAYWGGDIPWVTPTDITACRTNYLEQTEYTISKQGLLGSSAKLLPVGAILLTSRASIGLSKIAKTPVTTNQGFKSLVPKQGVDGTFLFYQTQRLRGAFERFAAGSTFLEINKRDTERILLPHPTDPVEQKRIATILTGIDTAIEKTEALVVKYQQIKAGLMHDLFTRGVLPNGQLRPIESSSSTQFGKIPFGWKLGSILELTDPQRQPILTGPFGADLGNADFVAEGIPVLRIGNVQQGELDLSDLLYVTPRKAALLSRYRIKSGDLLFARQGATTGRNALATKLVDGFLINYHIIRVALDHERCAPLFVEAAFANEVVKRQIERDKGRGTREGINTAQITSLAFPIAPLNEQRQIAQILKKINLQIEATQAELNSYRMRKCGLMHDLLTGKVHVKVEEPEVVDG